MAKKCIICKEEARFCIKDTSDYYCEECAIDNFGDISMLLKVEEQAQLLKEMIKEKMKEKTEEEQETETENNEEDTDEQEVEEVSEEVKLSKEKEE